MAFAKFGSAEDCEPQDGAIPASAAFGAAPIVRFTKQLPTGVAPVPSGTRFGDQARSQARRNVPCLSYTPKRLRHLSAISTWIDRRFPQDLYRSSRFLLLHGRSGSAIRTIRGCACYPTSSAWMIVWRFSGPGHAGSRRIHASRRGWKIEAPCTLPCRARVTAALRRSDQREVDVGPGAGS